MVAAPDPGPTVQCRKYSVHVIAGYCYCRITAKFHGTSPVIPAEVMTVLYFEVVDHQCRIHYRVCGAEEDLREDPCSPSYVTIPIVPYPRVTFRYIYFNPGIGLDAVGCCRYISGEDEFLDKQHVGAVDCKDLAGFTAELGV
jgi:hypothetical protein